MIHFNLDFHQINNFLHFGLQRLLNYGSTIMKLNLILSADTKKL